jgi:hypothetical protein
VSARPFVTAEQFDLVNLQNQASAALRQITRNASTCADNIKNCQFPDVAIPAIVLPQRKDGTPIPDMVGMDPPPGTMVDAGSLIALEIGNYTPSHLGPVH